MVIEKTVFTNSQPPLNYPPPMQQKKNSKLPVIFLAASILILGAALIYYFAIYRSDPKITINISAEGGIEQKGTNIYEMLYNNTGNIIIEIIASKKPANTEYYLTVAGEKETIVLANENGIYKFVKKITPKNNINSQFQVSLVSSKGTQLLNENMGVSILRPTMSSREFIENYLRTFSDAYTSKSFSRLGAAQDYYADGIIDPISNKIKPGFPDKSYYYFDNVISSSNDDITARVYINRYNDMASTSYNYFYKFKMKVVKSNSGIPEWKIGDFSEVLEKKDVFNYNNMEGGD